MIKKNRNKKWTEEELNLLKKLVTGNTPSKLIAYQLNRTESSIRSKAQSLGLSLKPTNQSPYNRRKK